MTFLRALAWSKSKTGFELGSSTLCSIATKIWICKIFRCWEIPKRWRLSVVQVRNVYSLLDFSLSTRGERERHNFYYADCSYIAYSQPPAGLTRPRVKSQLTDPTNAHPVAPSWTAQPRVKTQLTSFFRNPVHRFRAWRHSHPSHIFYLGFLLWHLWLSYPLRTRVNCTQCVPLHQH